MIRFSSRYRSNCDILTKEQEGAVESMEELFRILSEKEGALDDLVKDIIKQIGKKDTQKKLRKIRGTKFPTVFSPWEENENGGVRNVRQNFVINKLDFYLRLLLTGKWLRRNRKESYGAEDIYGLVKKLCGSGLLGKWDVSGKAIQYLCTDYLWQVMNEVTEEEFRRGERIGDYRDMYIQSDFLVHEAASYTEYSKYGDMIEKHRNNKHENTRIPVDFYSDLYLFYELNQYIIWEE